MSKKILILAGGGVKHLKPFTEAGERLGADTVVASFSKLEYFADNDGFRLTVEGIELKEFSVVYFRLVGKRYEDAALVVNYCRENGIRIVDKTYEFAGLIRIPVPKSIECKLLLQAGVSVPRTYFGKLADIALRGPEIFGYPFVIKGTMGKQGHAVWSPTNEKELEELISELLPREKKNKERFIAQEFIKASQRSRVFIIGGKAIAGITRPTRWRKRFLEKVNGEYPEGIRAALDPIPEEDAILAVKAAEALGVEVGGADVITDDFTGEKYILEVNSAPRWASLKKDTGIDVEEEIIKYLTSLRI
jgi:glutathione synthase/RimK-type ligase-like ATP-grasp enzyme